jgi:hypothetical protein
MRIIIFLMCLSMLASTEPALAGGVPGAAPSNSWVAKARVKARKKRKRRRRRRRRSKRVKKKAVKKKVTKPVTPQPKPKADPEPVTVPVTKTTNSTPSKEAEPGSEEQKFGVAVMQVQALHGVETSLADLLSEVVLTRTTHTGVFKSVIGGSDLQEVMSLEQQKGALGCDNDSCLATVGGALGVPRMIVGSIGKLGQNFLLNIKLIDVEEAKVLARVNKEANSESELKTSVEQLVDELLGVSSSASDASDASAPIVGHKPSRGMVAAGLGLAGVGVLSALGSWVLMQQAHSKFNDSNQTLGDYDQGIETTYYANTALVVGLSTAVVGGAVLSFSTLSRLSAP